tara:strand:+ start:229 stop:1728 length:1500 start_codon:yes stop_codon:yes gene_type:complete
MPHRPGHGTQRRRIERQARSKRPSSTRKTSRRVLRDAKSRRDERRANIREQARNPNNNRRSNVATGGTSTGRESGIMASQKTNKIKSLEQSVGSLDRRINNALEKGNTDLAKDLRSRLNKFTTQLGDERAKKIDGGVLRTDSGSIVKTSSGRPVLTNRGLAAFNQTKDIDFLDPTRKLQNEYPEEFAKMYPIANQLNKGLPTTRIARTIGQELLGIEPKPIGYTDSDMPGVRYPLDTGFGAGEGEPEATTIDDFDKSLDRAPDAVPLPDVIIRQKPEPPIDKTDVTSKSEIQPNKEVLPYVPPFIDAEKVNPKLNEVIGTDNLPINLYNQNMAEFLADEERNLALKQPAITGLKDENIIMPGTQVSGENFANQVAENNMQLKQNVVANPELNDQQKEMILKEIDDLTGFESTSLLPAGRSDPVEFDQYVGDALANLGQPQINTPAIADPSIPNPQSEADALAILNSLDNTVDERSLFERLFDSNPDQPGTQFINLNPNR